MGEVLEFYSGLTYSPKNVIKFGGTFVLRSSNVKDGEIIDADNVYVESNVVNCINVNVGDVIVVVRNGSRSLIGKHAQIKHEMTDTVIGAFMTGLRSSQSNFINALLDTPQFDIEITKNLGATINQITTGAFKQMNFCIPKLKEEQALIGTFFRTLDSLIAANQRKVDRLKQM
ncbi:MAG: restriction endonuclease subunit S, partial [Erysipelotrichales bacterium]|nr:restriction endonuclease subunit S [Erysipelotrichales bacterium]